MGLFLNQITDNDTKNFLFEDIQGSLVQQHTHVELLVRPGIDEPSLRKIGFRGDPLTIRTVGYRTDLLDCKLAEANYQSLIDGDVCKIVQHGVDYGNFHIIKVRQVTMEFISNAIGALIGAAAARQICEWSIVGE